MVQRARDYLIGTGPVQSTPGSRGGKVTKTEESSSRAMRLAIASLFLAACSEEPPSRGGTGGSPSGAAGAGAGGIAGDAAGSGVVAGSGGAPLAGMGGSGATGQGGIAMGGTIAGGALGGAGAAGSAGNAGTSGGSGSAGMGSAGMAGAGMAGTGGGVAGAAGRPSGPNVDRSDPRLNRFDFTAREADPLAGAELGNQFAFLDTRVAPVGKLVVFLHGASSLANCGNGALATLVAGWGFHWFAPCYSASYGVDNCGNDTEGCRLEAFEGSDHHALLNIARPDSIEERIVRGLLHLQSLNPGGDWRYYLDGAAPRWSEIIVSGHSHGASSSGVIAVHRIVARAVMLAGPYDPGQAWLSSAPLTPRSRFFGFTHSADSQHSGHLAALAALGVPGAPVSVDAASPPYGGSQRLLSSAALGDPHGSVASGNIGAFVDAWRYLYGAP